MARWVMTLCGIVVALVMLTSQYGCTTAVNKADQAADTIVESSIALHDKQVAAGHVLMCGAPIRALVDHYKGNPVTLRAIMVVCGYSALFDKIWIGDASD